MRLVPALLLVLSLTGGKLSAQSCTGLCLQQVSCPAGTTTSISGTVFAPNGNDPLPNVLVFIPNAPVEPFTGGVSCPVIGQPPSGSPLVGTTTAVDGTFTLTNVPVGSAIPLVVQSGRWRRQVTVPTTSACTNTAFSTKLPSNQSEGDIPRIAISTGMSDQVECALRKVGVDLTEFTNPADGGRINLYQALGSKGARIDVNTPSALSLMGDLNNLKSYDVLMLPCEGSPFPEPADQLANLVAYANAGGRVYGSHFAYEWMYTNPPFSTVVSWHGDQARPPNGTATIDVTFAGGQTLAQWLQIVEPAGTPGQIDISTLRHDFDAILAPTQNWLTLNNATYGNPSQQFTFNTPVGAANQCGRVLFNEYHVENPPTTPANKTFPTECTPETITAQEKLLEYMLFDLTSNGGEPTLTPASQDFGSTPIGFTSGQQTFTWKNNSIFAASVSSTPTTGDFLVTGNNCTSVAAGATCSVNVVFKPTALGARTGLLTVVSSGKTITAALTGTGTPDLATSSSAITFGSLDVGASGKQIFTMTNNTPGAIPLAAAVATGDYTTTSNCGASIAPLSSCTVTVTFTPAGTGPRAGSLSLNPSNAAYAGTSTTLNGNGVDFTVVSAPSSGSVIAGNSVKSSVITSPIAGFAANVSLTCTTTAPAATCVPALGSFIPASAVTSSVQITTTAKYVVVGYGGVGRIGLAWMIAIASGGLLWLGRRRGRRFLSSILLLLLIGAGSLSMTGCGNKLPALNPAYTPPGGYTFTLTATDGFLVHSATYALNVTAQ